MQVANWYAFVIYTHLVFFFTCFMHPLKKGPGMRLSDLEHIMQDPKSERCHAYLEERGPSPLPPNFH